MPNAYGLQLGEAELVELELFSFDIAIVRDIRMTA